MKLTVTQNVNEFNIKATQSNIEVLLQPIINTSDSMLYQETDPIFLASEANLFVAGDKANLDNQSNVNTGDETTLSIQTKRPLKTVNGESLEGNGNVQIDYNDLDNLPTLISNHSGLNLDDGTNPHGTTKSDVGLSNVDNTSDVDKPISTATQIALDEINSTVNPDRILTLGTETKVDNVYTYQNYSWILNNIEYTNTTPDVLTIAPATTGFKRKDISVFTNNGTIQIVQGIETDGATVTTPEVPEGTLYFKFYDIDGATVVDDPTSPIVGDVFIKKSDFQTVENPQFGTDVIVGLPLNGASYINFTNPLLESISGVSFLTPVDQANEPPYPGKPYILRNLTGNPITIKNNQSVLFFERSFQTKDGLDIVIPNNEMLMVTYGSTIMDVFRSWADVSEKLDKSTTPSSIYATDLSGDQTMIPFSAFTSSPTIYKLPAPTDFIYGITAETNLLTYEFPANFFNIGDYIEISRFIIEKDEFNDSLFFLLYFTNNPSETTRLFGDGFIKGFAMSSGFHSVSVRRGITISDDGFVGYRFENADSDDVGAFSIPFDVRVLDITQPIYLNVTTYLGNTLDGVRLHTLIINKY